MTHGGPPDARFLPRIGRPNRPRETSAAPRRYDHKGINEALGSPSDTAGETRVVMDFLTAALTEAKPPRIKFRQRPPNRVLVRGAKARVRFRLASKPGGADFECSLDRRPPR